MPTGTCLIAWWRSISRQVACGSHHPAPRIRHPATAPVSGSWASLAQRAFCILSWPIQRVVFCAFEVIFKTASSFHAALSLSFSRCVQRRHSGLPCRARPVVLPGLRPSSSTMRYRSATCCSASITCRRTADSASSSHCPRVNATGRSFGIWGRTYTSIFENRHAAIVSNTTPTAASTVRSVAVSNTKPPPSAPRQRWRWRSMRRQLCQLGAQIPAN